MKEMLKGTISLFSCVRRSLPALLLLVSPFFRASAAEAEHGFTFTGPEIVNWGQVTMEGSGTTGGPVLVYAALDNSGNFNAIVAAGKVAVTPELMGELRDGMGKKMAAGGIGDYEVLDARIVEVGAVPGIRMVGKGTFSSGPKRQLTYILPGKAHHAVLTYTAAAEEFDALVPAFDKAAQRTKGLVSHLSTQAFMLRGALIGGALAALYMLLKKLFGI